MPTPTPTPMTMPMPTPTPTLLCSSSCIQASKQRELYFLQGLRCKINAGCEETDCCWLLTHWLCALSCSLLFPSSAPPSRHLVCRPLSSTVCTHILTAAFLILLPGPPPALPLSSKIPPTLVFLPHTYLYSLV